MHAPNVPAGLSSGKVHEAGLFYLLLPQNLPSRPKSVPLPVWTLTCGKKKYKYSIRYDTPRWKPYTRPGSGEMLSTGLSRPPDINHSDFPDHLHRYSIPYISPAYILLQVRQTPSLVAVLSFTNNRIVYYISRMQRWIITRKMNNYIY